VVIVSIGHARHEESNIFEWNNARLLSTDRSPQGFVCKGDVWLSGNPTNQPSNHPNCGNMYDDLNENWTPFPRVNWGDFRLLSEFVPPQSSTIKWVRCLSTKWAPTSCKYRVITLLIGVIARVTHLFWAIIWLITPFFTNVGAHSWMAVSGRYQRMLRMPRAQTVLGSIESFTQNGSEVQGWWKLGFIFSTGFPWSRCFAQMIRLMKSYYVYQFVISFSTKIVGWTQGEECKQINQCKKHWRSWESHVLFFSPSGVLLGRCCCVSTVFQAPARSFFCHESRVNDEISLNFTRKKVGNQLAPDTW